MKKIILIFSLIMLSSLVVAFDEGQTITQQQLDNINLSTYSVPQLITFFQCRMENSGGLYYGNNQLIFYKSFSCLSLKGSGEDYLIYRETFDPYIIVSEFLACVVLDGRASCLSEYIENLRQQARYSILSIKEKIEDFQEPTIEELLPELIGEELW